MKNLSNLTKKQKLVTLIASVLVVCGIALVVMYATGIFPAETKGAIQQDPYAPFGGGGGGCF